MSSGVCFSYRSDPGRTGSDVVLIPMALLCPDERCAEFSMAEASVCSGSVPTHYRTKSQTIYTDFVSP
jgi:hypothetical protein